jgi:DNA-binding transcriptional LysR family regulator
MNARVQSRVAPLDPQELRLLLALTRAGTLAGAAARLAVDTSTVFRSLQRLERRVGRTLFERSRTGYRPTELAAQLAGHAERIEAEVEGARSLLQAGTRAVSGEVRVTTTDTILSALVLPSLPKLLRAHPLLQVEIVATNEPASLTRRDADIALRATKRPPEHLVGKHLGPIRNAVYAPPRSRVRTVEQAIASGLPWIAVDDALPEHGSVAWRRKHLPKIRPQVLASSIMAVADAVAAGIGVGIVPMFLGEKRPMQRVSSPLAEIETQLWLLTHAESRHLTRISTVFAHFARELSLD